ncbi:MAG: hypothetical protein ABH884_01195 [Candidatus Komeilibacteria bacterium]
MKMFSFLGIMALLSISPILGETKIKIDQNGYLHEIEVVDTLRSPTPFEVQALNNPGEKTYLPGQTSWQRESFFYLVSIITHPGYVIFDSESNKLNTIYETSAEMGDKVFAHYIIFLFVAMLFLFLSNLATISNSRVAMVTFATAGVATSAFVAANTTAGVVAGIGVLAGVVAGVAMVAYVTADTIKPTYWLASVLSYILLIIALFV